MHIFSHCLLWYGLLSYNSIIVTVENNESLVEVRLEGRGGSQKQFVENPVDLTSDILYLFVSLQAQHCPQLLRMCST